MEFGLPTFVVGLYTGEEDMTYDQALVAAFGRVGVGLVDSIEVVRSSILPMCICVMMKLIALSMPKRVVRVLWPGETQVRKVLCRFANAKVLVYSTFMS